MGSVLEKYTWHWNRLRCMSPPEISYRLRGSLVDRMQRWGFLTAKVVPVPDFSLAAKNWLHPINEIEASLYCQAGDAVLEGRFKLFAMENDNLGRVPSWNCDPRTGRAVRLSFGKTIDYRNPALVGDIKYLWEPNRHLQLVTLAQAYYLSDDTRYLDGVLTLLNSWLKQCPYLMGPNWTSSLELGIRLINWSIVWQLIGGLDCPLFAGANRFFLNRWMNSIYQHAHFIRMNFSRFSSANNHLIGEAAGLFVATITWPFWKNFTQWQRQSQEILVHEALLQNTRDGVNREQAISYQQFVLDFMLISALAGLANGIEFPKAYWDRIEAMLEYMASVMDVAGNVPMIGDADDGYVVRLSQEESFCPYRSLQATGAILFGRGDLKKKANILDDKTRWLLGERAESEFAVLKVVNPTLPPRRAFPEGGYYILGRDFETDEEIRLIVDAGALGYDSIAAHGHADALAFTLSYRGREFLIDPGTYCYHTQKEWRNYFRGTTAHNALRVDGQDQSVIGGNFMWLKKAEAVCEVWKTGGDVERFVGSHNGYMRLPDSVLHRREIVLFRGKKEIVVTDIVNCRGVHVVERFWHFSEQCKVSLNGSITTAENKGTFVRMRAINSNAKIMLLHGNISPPGGWISRGFDTKIPTSTVVFRNKIQGTTQLVTIIDCDLLSNSKR